eukprot:CAMPEP_0176102834 /NCGR_PEP_ID=MMETSP0120_2-20121206/51588_1 /TAXON_ID=160619 /ORGANISM="Kryptoperidinium foliaceum, Strain CCMP 1326" /LENGTH=1287 /DNA_ID=CAMNT_0017436909 /DNA_START=94 /DNA_END=3957 /DNA_ORIENTATION=-
MSDSSKKRPSTDVIDLTLDSDDDEGSKKPAAVPKRARVKTEGQRSMISHVVTPAIEEDGLEIVDPSAETIVPAASMPSTSNDDEIEVVGAKNETKLPHMRQHCTHFKFDPAAFDFRWNYQRNTIDTNAKTCDLCYCYVCDKLVKECTSWCSETSTQRGSNHCCASDSVQFWKTQRMARKNGVARMPQDSDNESDDSSNDPTARLDRFYDSLMGRYRDYDDSDSEDYYGFGGGYTAGRFNPFFGRAPRPQILPPEKAKEAANDPMMVKCRKCTYFSRIKDDRPGNCLKCGRVATVEALTHKASTQRTIVQNASNTFLGVREFSFKIEASDPRKDGRFASSWRANKDSPHWQYSEEEQEHDVFHTMMGPRPNLYTLEGLFVADGRPSSNKNSFTGLSGSDYAMMQHLEMIPCQPEFYASWNLSERRGKLTVKVYFTPSAFNSGCGEVDHFSIFLGIWFGIFPFKLSDFPWRGKEMSQTHIESMIDDSVEYFPTDRKTRIKDRAKSAFSSLLDEYNEGRKTHQDRLKLLCSTGKQSQGHVCDDDSSFSGVLRRYFGLRMNSISRYGFGYDGLSKVFGDESEGAMTRLGMSQHLLGRPGALFYNEFIRDSIESFRHYTIQGIMASLENLGHDPVDYVEGLRVELLEFQRHSLKWALERETMKGGIQSLLWAKLPDDPVRKEVDLYYCPLTGRLRRQPPRLVRGGFIAEEMGLGKTVITLALILKNPAPVEPASGSRVPDIQLGRLPAPWDSDLYSQYSSPNAKDGSILCRGTLVICPVSLVGQWAEEARSKLQDPGLVYEYHGQGRKRDAHILSQNSIVVTTYQVVASDATYHAKRAGSDYCPPLQQIRWWRIVCDEGHSLRQGQTQRSKAVLSLVADHKWLVSGTPLNTSIKDLSTQFKFLGIDHADEIVRTGNFTDIPKRQRGHLSETERSECLQFLLGGMMMRHSQKQKYRGTETTLMSLPNKTERSIDVTFAESEKLEYANLEKSAHDFYVSFRRKIGRDITKHYLKIMTKILPLRVACAGGKYPIPEESEKIEEGEDGTADEETKVKAPKKYSSFVFTSKLKVLVAELEKIRDTDPSSKSLVFSQFSSTLEWLQEELPKHGFQYRTLAGSMSMKQRARALHDFQSDPPTTIFLLSMRSGAVGINLTQASKVFLLEPSLNPALESQAIGRVHRLGQKREVEIIRLVQKDTVESRMMKFLDRKYGSKTDAEETKDDTESDDDNGDGEPKAATVGVVGNVARDKVDMMTEDFDLLFGAEAELVAYAGMDDTDEPMPFAAISSSEAGGVV